MLFYSLESRPVFRGFHSSAVNTKYEMSFSASEATGKSVMIDAGYVEDKLGALAVNEDLSRYVL